MRRPRRSANGMALVALLLLMLWTPVGMGESWAMGLQGPARPNGAWTTARDEKFQRTADYTDTVAANGGFPLEPVARERAPATPTSLNAGSGGRNKPAIDIWYGNVQEFGRLGNPQDWINIPGTLALRTKHPLTYSLNGGKPVRLRVGPDGRRLVRAGDFNVEIPVEALRPGVNTVVIRTKDKKGRKISITVRVLYRPERIWRLPYHIDWRKLRAPEDIQQVAQVVDGQWEVQDGEVRVVSPGYDRIIAIGDRQWRDYQVETSITIYDFGSRYGVGVLLRWNGHTDDPVKTRNPRSGWLPLGAIGWFHNGRLEIMGTRWRKALQKGWRPVKGRTYNFRMRVVSEANGQAVYRLKVWEDGKSEPKKWNLVARGRKTDPAYGSLLLIAHRAKVSFGPVTVTPVR